MRMQRVRCNVRSKLTFDVGERAAFSEDLQQTEQRAVVDAGLEERAQRPEGPGPQLRIDAISLS